MHTRDILNKGIKWSIGDENLVDLWNDWWCGTGPLADSFPGSHTKFCSKVREIIDNGAWKLDSIEHIVDSATLNEIASIPLPIYTQDIDHPSWVNSTNGICTASMAYEFINKDINDIKGWLWLWKLKLPRKLKTFIWLIIHNKLPTNFFVLAEE